MSRGGLGAAFTLEVEAAIQRIVKAPERWQVTEQDVRRCLTHTFPYGILYTVEPEGILIVSKMHLHRKPDYWQNRLSGGVQETT